MIGLVNYRGDVHSPLFLAVRTGCFHRQCTSDGTVLSQLAAHLFPLWVSLHGSVKVLDLYLKDVNNKIVLAKTVNLWLLKIFLLLLGHVLLPKHVCFARQH